jgi:hypothetical protein
MTGDMIDPRPRHRAHTLVAVVLVVAIAAIVAAGCSGASSTNTSAGADSIQGGLALIPKGAVGAARVSLKQSDLATSVATLERVPLFNGLLATYPAAKDRNALIGQVLSSAHAPIRAADVTSWLGNYAGAAVLSLPANMSDAGSVVWVDTKSDSKAEAFVKKQLGSGVKTTSDAGVNIYEKDGGVVFVDAGAVVVTKQLTAAKQVIEAHDGGDPRFIDEPYVAQLMDPPGHPQVADAVDVSQVLDAVHTLAQNDHAAEVRSIAPLLDKGGSLRDLLPKMVGGSFGVDDVGVRAAVSWAPAAKPGVDDARQMTERLPRDVVSASGYGAVSADTDKKAVQVLKDALADEHVNPAVLPAACPPKVLGLCALGSKLLTDVTSGDLIGRLDAARGAHALTVSGQLAGAGVTAPGFGNTASITREDDFATVSAMYASAIHQLAPLLAPYGVSLTWTGSGTNASVGVRLLPKGPLFGKMLPAQRAMLVKSSPQLGQLFTTGIGGAFSPLDAHTEMFAMPAAAGEPFAAAWNAKAPQLKDNPQYQRDVKAAGVPDRTSLLMWMDLGHAVTSEVAQLAQLSAGSGSTTMSNIKVANAMLTNNFQHVGGLVVWSTRGGSGNDIGTVHVTVPLYQ